MSSVETSALPARKISCVNIPESKSDWRKHKTITEKNKKMLLLQNKPKISSIQLKTTLNSISVDLHQPSMYISIWFFKTERYFYNILWFQTSHRKNYRVNTFRIIGSSPLGKYWVMINNMKSSLAKFYVYFTLCYGFLCMLCSLKQNNGFYNVEIVNNEQLLD